MTLLPMLLPTCFYHFQPEADIRYLNGRVGRVIIIRNNGVMAFGGHGLNDE